MDWLEGIMLSEIGEIEEDKCCRIPFIWRIKKKQTREMKQTHRYREQASSGYRGEQQGGG